MKFSISINIAIFGKVADGYTHYFSTFWKCPARDHTNWNTLTVLQENLNPNPIPTSGSRFDEGEEEDLGEEERKGLGKGEGLEEGKGLGEEA